MVAILDALQLKGFVERRSNDDDRRQYSLHITEKGLEALEKIAQIARQHQECLCASLSREESDTLAKLLQKIADEQGLKRDVHPGYRWMRPR